QVDLIRGPDRILGLEDSDFVAVLDAAADESVAIAGQRLIGRVGDLTGQPESARRVAERAGVALDEDAMEDGVLGVINPMLLGEVLTADSEIDAADRDAAQSTGGGTYFGRRLLAHQPHQH